MKKLFNRDYLLILQGNAVSDIGDLLYSVAIGYWVYEKTGSSALMGVMSSISMFVTMFLSPFTGSIVDKISRRWIIVGMDVLRGIIMLVLGVLAWTDSLSVPVVLLAAFAASLCSVFFNPAVNTLMIDLIPHDDMVRGQSVFSATNALINLLGKAFSGVLVAFLGVPLIVVLNGASYLISAVTEMFIRVPRTVQQGERVTVKGVLTDFGRAMKDIFSDRCLKLFVPFALLLNLLAAGPMSLMLPFCMEKGFTMDMYGYLLSVEVAGSLLCVLLLGLRRIQWTVDMIRLKMRRWYWPAIGAGLSLLVAVVILLNPFETLATLWVFTGIALIAEAVVDVLTLIFDWQEDGKDVTA